MKVIQQFDEHHGVWLSAVLKDNTEVARLSNRNSRLGFQLYEVWLLDENEKILSPELLHKMCFNSVKDLSRHYCPETSSEPLHAASRELDLIRELAINLHVSDARFHHSVVSTPDGPVCSIVFGSYQAMKLVYEEGLRTSREPVAEDESSI